ncbi:MAG TPA: hypothetical protein VK348_08340, partial [Planctomycetota bacterium]|nr:hypothetical protein [Planctomycetota bacterium]
TRIVGVPNGNNGYVLAASASTMFQALTTNLNLTDDSISGPITLPFTFVHPAGQTNVICVSSNGFIWFQSGGSDRAFSDHTILLQDPPSLAALWMDLNPDPPINGGVFADPDPNGQVFYVTWSGVPEYNHPASANTFQIALFANGNFELRYPSAGTVAHTALVGYSTGNGAPDPGPIDWSAALPFNTGTGGAPLELDAAPGSRPRIGTTFTLQTARIPAGTPLGFMLLGFNRTATDLTPLGMAGCTGFVGLQASSHTALAFATPATVVPFPINVPNNNALVGVTVFAQSATLSTGFTPLGVIASNGGQLDLGR